MDIIEQNVTVRMCRETLAGVPCCPPAAGYQLRLYAPSDEHEWVRIECAADKYNAITLDLYRREFGHDPLPLAARQLFLLDPQGRAIGTSTAWMDDDHRGRPYGRIHWVAIHPDWQGRGLAKPLLSRTCARLRELGHDRAYLVTSTARLNAINLYRQFGFVPEIIRPEDERVWAQVYAALDGRPAPC